MALEKPKRIADSTLLAAQAGDEAALTALLVPHEGMLRSLCRGVLGSTDEAEDALQETFLKAIQGLGSFRGESELKTWLVRIALNVCYSARRRPLLMSLQEEFIALTMPSPERQVVGQALLDEALATLSVTRRAAYLLKIEGWSLKEIGLAQGWSESRVKVELFRTRQILAKWAGHQRELEEEVK
ncbi:RNA polymerase sigma factor [Armatimonas sp.]|uniref:RNA polymerase sigma factor n=1 Tax=Armatimonas sp. TaxID=1872638 RepID=UPI00286B882B|nr:RNA polymerase sigma factor [Armatimonas sp.]